MIDDLNLVLGASALSPQFRDHIRGRLQHYSAGLKHIRVYAAIFLNDGDDLDNPCAENRPKYTVPVPFSPILLDACRHLLWVINTYKAAGSDLWPPIPSSLHGAFVRNENLGFLMLEITGDASVTGWGAVVK